MIENWTELYKQDRVLCDCEECRSGKYDQKDYMLYEEDFLRLDNKRPIGITGHLRAKNEALSIGQCIESCIDFLDELIVTYNDSEDETAAIIQQYAAKYPDKIRVYHYKPEVMPHTYYERYKDLSKTKKFLNSNSIHNASNYYNFGYTKISYKYYMKIDGDQIYFTDKMMQVKKAFCNKWINFISGNIPNLFVKILNRIFKRFHIDSFLYKHNLFLLIKLLLFDKNIAFELGGVNLFVHQGEFTIPIESVCRGINFFNGMMKDTSIHIPNSLNRYIFDVTHLYESLWAPNHSYRLLGVCWIHLNPVKNKVSIPEEILKTNTLLELSIMTWKQLFTPSFENLLLPDNAYIYNQYILVGENFWNKDRKYITQKFYDKYFPSILEYYQKNIADK